MLMPTSISLTMKRVSWTHVSPFTVKRSVSIVRLLRLDHATKLVSCDVFEIMGFESCDCNGAEITLINPSVERSFG